MNRGRGAPLAFAVAVRGAGGRRGTWEFLLEPLPSEGTRLLVRVRVGEVGRLRLALWRAVHRLMQARQLRGLRRRAEARRHAATVADAQVRGAGEPAAPAASGRRMTRLLRAENGMNIVGQGGRIMLFAAPALLGAVLAHLFAPDLVRLPIPPRLGTPTGVALLLAGIALWGAAVVQLLTGFSRGKLVTTGAYSLVRNPIYASVGLLVLPGLALVTATWGYLVAAATLILAVRLFITREERELLRVFGDEYRSYLSAVHRILPFVRPKGGRRREAPRAPF